MNVQIIVGKAMLSACNRFLQRGLSRMDFVLSQTSPDKIQVLQHTQYVTSEHITPSNVARDPLDQFRAWFKEVGEGGVVKEPEATSLSTATPSGVPSARMVLLKQVDSRGFVFYTNYTSRKSQELMSNPHAALVFFWREVHRSVRVVGSVEKLSKEESAAYFHSRPIGSQLGAWASKQSSVIGEGELEERLQRVTERFGDGEVPAPEFWGGWRVIPKEIEFWCGKQSRLHDRVRYLRVNETTEAIPEWQIDRLSP